MTVKLSSQLPEGDKNGLGAIEAALLHNSGDKHVLVAIVDCKQISQNVDTGESTATARIRAVEAFTATAADGAELARLLRRAHEERTGQSVLPIEIERELDALRPHSDDEPSAGGGEQ